MYNVLGISPVMEEVGRGAKLVLRYPSQNLQETLLSYHLSPGRTEVMCYKKRQSRVTHKGVDMSSKGELAGCSERTQECLNKNDQSNKSIGTHNSNSIRGTTWGFSFGLNSSREGHDNHSRITSHFRHINTPENGTISDERESRLLNAQQKHKIQPKLSNPTASSLKQSNNDGTQTEYLPPSLLSKQHTYSNMIGSTSSK